VVGWSWDLLDELVATNISAFTEADVRELSSRHPESSHWLANHFLNSTFRAQYSSPVRELVVLFLRRVSIAFEEYELARARTDEFLLGRRNGEQPTRLYLSALHHWEQCLAAICQAMKAWTELTGDRVFDPEADPAPPEAKVNHLHNWSKHSDEKVAKPNLMPERGPLAVWMTNDGLRSRRHRLTWTELTAVLDDIANAANVLQDPRHFVRDA